MRVGDRIAERFEIEAEAGAGGMGTVYRARDRFSGGQVAVKVLLAEGDGERRFVREAQALAELHHPGIVRYIDHGRTAEGQHYLAMEWLGGQSVEELLSRRGLSLQECVTLVGRVAEALAEAHRRGIVHRDIKPANLILEGESLGSVKIVDFGVVRLRERAQAMTQTGVLMGTPGYMAPEQAKGIRELDVRADVFSLGVVLYECLTGAPPFQGAHMMAVLAKILLEEAPRVEELRPDVPPQLAELVHAMLAKEPEGRPADAGRVAESLASLSLVAGALPSVVPRRAALTLREQRLVSVLLLASGCSLDPHAETFDGDATDEQAPTLEGSDDASSIADVRRAASRHGGHVEVLADKTVLVTLMTRGAATDQAASAALCALELRGAVDDATIVVATGSGEAGGGRPFGAALDRALAVLEGSRASAGIYLDEVTAGLLDQRFSIEEVVRGEGRCLHLRGEILQDRPTRTLMGSPTPCVGRRRELQILETILEESVEESIAQAVLVTSSPGLGKSRLRYEFVDRLRSRGDVEIWTAHGDLLSAGSPFGMIARVLRSALGIRDGEPEVSAAKLQAEVAAALPEAEHGRVTAFLGELCGVAEGAEAGVQLLAARRDPQVMADQLRRAWEDYLGAVHPGRVILVILEDLHWGDLPSIALIDHALRHLGRPMMVLALARPEVHETFPRLWAARGVTELQLRPLSHRACRTLIVEVLGDTLGEAGDDGLLERVIEQAAGNVLYLEELIRAVAEGKGDALPGSVLAMVQARLQGLDVGARKVLRAASAFGQIFWEGGVRALLGGEAELCDRWLEVLVADEVVSSRPVSQFVGECEYVFHHDLVRVAAYATLTDDDRALAHFYAGEWLERHGERDPVTLAEHFERGGQPERAVGHFVQAAAQAIEGNDFAAALEHVEHGLRCSATGEARGRLRLHGSVAHHWRGECAKAQAGAERALEELEEGSAPWYEAASVALTNAGSQTDHGALTRLVELLQGAQPSTSAGAERLIAAAHAVVQLNHTGRYALAESLLAWTREHAVGDLGGEPQVRAWIERAALMRAASDVKPGPLLLAGVASTEAFRRAGDLRMACYQGMNLGYGKIVVGLYDEAVTTLEEAADTARRLHLDPLLASLDSYLGYAQGLGPAVEAGMDRLRGSIAALRAEGLSRMEMRARNYLALILLGRGELGAAAEEVAAAVEISGSLPATRALVQTTGAMIAVRQGRVEEALAETRASVAMLAAKGSIEDGEPLLRLTHAQALAGSGAHEEAKAVIRSAHASLIERAATIADPSVRESFLGRVAVNSETVDLYRSLGLDA